MKSYNVEEKGGRGSQPPASSSERRKTDYSVSNSQPNGKVDLTARSTKMGRDECTVWPNKKKTSQNRPDFKGIFRLSGEPGHYYWVALWKGKSSFWCWFTPWDKTSYTGVEPLTDLTPIRIKLLSTGSGDPAFSDETRKANVELRPATCNGQAVWWLKLIAKKGGDAR